MRGPRREIWMMQIIGPNAQACQIAHQPLEDVDVVIDAVEQHGLREQDRARLAQPGDRRARRLGQFARMIDMQGDEQRLAAFAKRRKPFARDEIGRDRRRARMDAQELDMRDLGKPARDGDEADARTASRDRRR